MVDTLFWVAPNWVDLASLSGLLVTGFGAIGAYRKARAIKFSVEETQQKIARARLSHSVEEMRQLEEMLVQSVKEGNIGGARYILVWLAKESSRSVAFFEQSGIEPNQESPGAIETSGLLVDVADSATKAKSTLIKSSKAWAKLEPDALSDKMDRVVRPVFNSLDNTSRTLIALSADIGITAPKEKNVLNT